MRTFGVPDFRNRAIWGSGDGTFGYIEAGLPSIAHTHTATTSSNGAHTHSTTSAGNHFHSLWSGTPEVGNCFGFGHKGCHGVGGHDHTTKVQYRSVFSYDNSTRMVSTAGAHTHTANSNGAHTHTLTTSTFANSEPFGKSDTVQPPSIKIRVKCRAK